jgi:pantetheine-phosphate adenylyltransferase
MKRALCPGTFDPMTNGHLDVIERAAGIFDEVVVAVAVSPDKAGGPLFSVEERVDMVAQATSHLANVTVQPFDSLLVDLARQVQATVIVKGLRAVTDFEREFQMAQLNYRLDDAIETLFIVSVPEYMYLSSSAVKEIAGHGGLVTGLVPAHVNERLIERLG